MIPAIRVLGPSAAVVVMTMAPAGLCAQAIGGGEAYAQPGLTVQGQADRRPAVERMAYLMGTRASVHVEADRRETALRASEAALDAMSSTEELLSTWRDDTDLARVNRAAPGTAFQPAPALAALLQEAAHWSRRTSGAFHPAVGALIDAWDLRGSGRVPADHELRQALDAAGDAGVLIDPRSGAVTRRDADAWLDAGAFGKGAALREARQALATAGISSARLDLGGQIVVLGDGTHIVSVAHPVHRDHPVYDLTVTDASVATSGQSERGIEVDGARYGHVLDPRDGRPVPAWGSVTVVHPDPLAADVLATALFVLGPDEGLELAESLDDVAALFLVTTGSGVTERMTPAMQRHHPLRSSETAFRGSRRPHRP